MFSVRLYDDTVAMGDQVTGIMHPCSLYVFVEVFKLLLVYKHNLTYYYKVRAVAYSLKLFLKHETVRVSLLTLVQQSEQGTLN